MKFACCWCTGTVLYYRYLFDKVHNMEDRLRVKYRGDLIAERAIAVSALPSDAAVVLPCTWLAS